MKIKRFFIHVFDNTQRKWKKVYRMCLTFAEASYNMALLEKAAKLEGNFVHYRIVCISIKPKSINQLELF